MKTILYTALFVLLWVINLFNGTGLGATYHTTEYAQIAVLIISCYLMYRDSCRRQSYYMPKRYFVVVVPMVVLFVLVSLFNDKGWVAFEYLWVFLVVYALSHTRLERENLYLVGIAYAALGLVILVVFNYMTILKGWNENSIAMIGLFSYLVFVIPFYGMRDKKSVFMIVLVGTVYSALIWPTGSRSCILAIVLSWLIIFRVLPLEKLFRSSPRLFLALQIPLVIAIVGSLLARYGDVAVLDKWSLSEVGKTFFNGRDGLWHGAFQRLENNILFGSGNVAGDSYYHNCAVDCMSTYGVLGYFLWIKLFHVILKEALPYRRDICAGGALSVFLLILWQQSVERGLFTSGPNLIPYVILGLLMARVRALKEQA